MIRKVEHGKLQGVLFAPSSKSYAQRALLAASLANGTSYLQNVGTCKDTEAIISVLCSLKADINSETVTGPISLHRTDDIPINVFESGLATRLLIPILAISNNTFHITGEGSLLSRKMDFLIDPLHSLQAEITLTDSFLPATITGPIRPTNLSIDCGESSQFLSGLLFALPLLNGESKIEARNLSSRPYIDMTLEVLSNFGITIRSEKETFTIPGNQSYIPTSYTVEGDWSGVSTIIAAPGCKTIRGLCSNSFQADRAILKVLSIAGIHYEFMGTDIKVYDSTPSSFSFDATDCPDLFPALAVIAARAKSGISHIYGTNRLINKESNRLQSIKDEFSKMGINVDTTTPNMMSIPGGQEVHAAIVDSHNDHRIAMALASLSLCVSDGQTTITNAESVNKSYCNFWNDFNSLYRYE